MLTVDLLITLDTNTVRGMAGVSTWALGEMVIRCWVSEPGFIIQNKTPPNTQTMEYEVFFIKWNTLKIKLQQAKTKQLKYKMHRRQKRNQS